MEEPESDSPKCLLTKLANLLAETAPLSEEPCPVHGSDYTEQYDEVKKASVAHHEMIRELVAEKICQLVKQRATNSFKILSIGCGNGLADWSMLQIVTERFPGIEINYIGLNIDEKCCESAREKLNSLRNVKADTSVLNFEQTDCSKADIPPCDLVLAEHIFYYMRDINKAISDAHKLLKPNGNMIIIIVESQSANSQLYQLFWHHEHKWPLNMSDSIVESLNTLGIKHEMKIIAGEIVLTESFKDGFTKSHQKCILEGLTHTKTDRYPPAVAQTCIDYLSSISEGKPEQYKVPRTTAIITCGSS